MSSVLMAFLGLMRGTSCSGTPSTSTGSAYDRPAVGCTQGRRAHIHAYMHTVHKQALCLRACMHTAEDAAQQSHEVAAHEPVLLRCDRQCIWDRRECEMGAS